MTRTVYLAVTVDEGTPVSDMLKEIGNNLPEVRVIEWISMHKTESGIYMVEERWSFPE